MPAIEENVVDVLDRLAIERPEHPAIVDGANILTYRSFQRAVEQVASNLCAFGFEVGDVVALKMPDSANYLVLLCALARIGAVLYAVPPQLTMPEVTERLRRIKAKALISKDSTKTPLTLQYISVRQILSAKAGPFQLSRIGGKNPVFLVESSGTTGRTKIFTRSHGDMLILIDRYAQAQGWCPEDRFLSLTPFCFNVFRNIFFGMLQQGATTVVIRQNECKSLEEFAGIIAEKQVTFLKLTPAHLAPLVAEREDSSLLMPNLRAMVVGSAPTSAAQRQLAQQRVSPNFYEQFATNETGLLAFATPSDRETEPDSVGRIVAGVEAQVVDGDGKVLAPGKIGEVRFRGAGFPTEYLDAAATSARALRDGWFYPGDLAMIGKTGYLFFKGRTDDLINNAGVKFYPVEVEQVLLNHPDVSEVAVFPISHDLAGQCAAACFVSSREVTAHELTGYCKSRMAGYKIPVVFSRVRKMPRNPMGKINKRELRDMLSVRIEKDR